MGNPNLLLLQILGMLAMPFAVALITAGVFWRSLRHRTLFLIVALLVFGGLSSLISPWAQEVFNPSLTGSAVYPSGQFNAMLANAVVVTLIGVPLLAWLRNALRT